MSDEEEQSKWSRFWTGADYEPDPQAPTEVESGGQAPAEVESAIDDGAYQPTAESDVRSGEVPDDEGMDFVNKPLTSAADIQPKQNQSQPPPGWYTDGKHDVRRWWDGNRWSSIYEPPPTQVAAETTGSVLTEHDDYVALLGYATGLLAPVVGILIGLTLIIRGHSQSISIIVLSIISGLLWSIFIFNLL